MLMDLENIMLSEISQRKTNTIWFHLYVESKKTKQMNVYTKTEADSQINETHYWLAVGREKGEGVG